MLKTAAMDALRNRGWLAGVPDPLREHILAQCDLVRLHRTESVYVAGDATGGLYGVASGWIELHLPGGDGAPTLTHVGGVGMWVGDVAAIAGQPRLITIVAGTDTELLRLPRAAMLRIAGADVDAWLHFARLQSLNFVRSLAVIAMLRRDDPVERVGALLLSPTDPADHEQLRVPGSQSDLGIMAGLGRTSVNVALRELERRGFIRRGYASIAIADRQGLESFTGLDAAAA